MGNVPGKESRSRSDSKSSSFAYNLDGTNASEGSIFRRHRSSRSGTITSFSSTSSISNLRGSPGKSSKNKDKEPSSNNGSSSKLATGLILEDHEMVDGGYLSPHGVYPGAPTFKQKVVRQLIVSIDWKNKVGMLGSLLILF